MLTRYSELVMPQDANVVGTLFGGQMVSWMDISAAKAVHRFLKDTEADTALTRAIDAIEFKEPVYVGNWVNFEANIIKVGNSSIIIQVNAYKEDKKEEPVLACKAIMNNIYDLDKASERVENEDKYHRYCQKAYDLDNNNPEAVVALSRSYNLRRDYEKRLELAEKALELNPHHSGALFDYALAITSFGRFEEALECIERSIELNPVEKKGTDYMMVMTRIGLKQFERAIELIDEMAKDGRGGIGQIGFKVACLAHKGDVDKARELLKTYLAQRPQVKNLEDYEKVVPTILKEILMNGMKIAGLPEK